MSNYSGNDTKFQLGIASTYGTAATPTVQLEYLSTTLKEGHTVKQSEALVGGVTSPYFRILGSKVEGDVVFEVHPDKLGEVLACSLGAEAAVTSGTDYETHTFTPVKGGTSLKSMSAVVDKKADIFGFDGLKVDSLHLECDPSSVLQATMSFIGKLEATDPSLVADLDASSFVPYAFNDLTVFVGAAGTEAATPLLEVTKMAFDYKNNLENDLYVADGTGHMAEIDYQKRDITADIDVLYDATTNTLRETYFKPGTLMSLKFVFTHPEKVTGAASQKYSFSISMKNVIMTEAPNDVGGPDRMKMSLKLVALERGTDPAVEIKTIDNKATKYLA